MIKNIFITLIFLFALSSCLFEEIHDPYYGNYSYYGPIINYPSNGYILYGDGYYYWHTYYYHNHIYRNNTQYPRTHIEHHYHR